MQCFFPPSHTHTHTLTRAHTHTHTQTYTDTQMRTHTILDYDVCYSHQASCCRWTWLKPKILTGTENNIAGLCRHTRTSVKNYTLTYTCSQAHTHTHRVWNHLSARGIKERKKAVCSHLRSLFSLFSHTITHDWTHIHSRTLKFSCSLSFTLSHMHIQT